MAKGPSEVSSYRDQAVARSLDSARARAESRVQRFLDAASELIATSDTNDFTVQEVVERSGQSLRSFYQYFGGKDELLLALFEENIRASAEYLRKKIDGIDDPVEALRRFVELYYAMCRPVGKDAKRAPQTSSPILVDFSLRLLTSHPDDAARGFTPLTELTGELLDAVAATGALRDDVDLGFLTGTLLEAVMFNVFSVTLGGRRTRKSAAAGAAELWDVFWRGVAAD